MAVEPFRKPRGHDGMPPGQQMQPQLIAERVGDTLAQAREARGESVAEVGRALRIRQPYLEAIERGDHGALPGPTYAIGFVRAYADYLNLDVPDLVRRYKEEAGTTGAAADLHFPTPLPEGRIPTRAILVLALMLTGAAYVGWWVFSREDRNIADLIPELPSSLSNLMNEPVASPPIVPPVAEPAPAIGAEVAPGNAAQPPAAAAPVPAPAPAEAPAQPILQPEQPPAAIQPSPASSGPAATAPAQPEGTVNTQDSAPSGADAESDTAPPDPEPVAPPANASQSPAAAVEPVPAVRPVEPAAAPPTVESAVPAAPAGSSTGRVFGAENAGSRIEVTATGDAWVEFRDGSGQLVFTRVMRRGDVFHVPDQPGLRLQTGNAGALSFKVDGATLPPIGPAGSVRRNVLIEPDSLKAGAPEAPAPAGAN